MNQPDSKTADSLMTAILGFLLPFFLTAAGTPDSARAAITNLIDAYNSSTPTELDLVGRVIGFSIAAMDNLRLSMTPGLPDTQVLRYRSNAATLSRASDQARKILESLQANRQPRQRIPRPTIAAAPKPVQSAPVEFAPAPPALPQPASPRPASAQPEPAQPEPAQPEPAQVTRTPADIAPAPPARASVGVAPRRAIQSATPALTPAEIETMKRDARIMMNVFSKSPTHGTSLIAAIPSAATLVAAAVKAAMPGARQSSAG